RIGASELFCPWDVCNFVHDALAARAEEGDGAVISAGNYWSGSESTNTAAIPRQLLKAPELPASPGPLLKDTAAAMRAP
ncbi:MAG: hypothetical protein SOT14_08345, partial [Succinivibrio sp.]|nr:hypothetical protein [Succinivibrio sp.]